MHFRELNIDFSLYFLCRSFFQRLHDKHGRRRRSSVDREHIPEVTQTRRRSSVNPDHLPDLASRRRRSSVQDDDVAAFRAPAVEEEHPERIEEEPSEAIIKFTHVKVAGGTTAEESAPINAPSEHHAEGYKFLQMSFEYFSTLS